VGENGSQAKQKFGDFVDSNLVAGDCDAQPVDQLTEESSEYSKEHIASFRSISCGGREWTNPPIPEPDW
jgi:hypothetical protein